MIIGSLLPAHAHQADSRVLVMIKCNTGDVIYLNRLSDSGKLSQAQRI